jgi:hypothetical protein
VEGLGFDLLMISDHIAVTPDVAEQYPPPFYESFTTLAWLAGLTERIKLGTTVLIVPYRHPLHASRRSRPEPATLGSNHDTRGHHGRPAVPAALRGAGGGGRRGR